MQKPRPKEARALRQQRLALENCTSNEGASAPFAVLGGETTPSQPHLPRPVQHALRRFRAQDSLNVCSGNPTGDCRPSAKAVAQDWLTATAQYDNLLIISI